VSLLATALRSVAVAAGDGNALDDVAIDALVADATATLAHDPDDPTWALADRIARLRDADPASVGLAVDWLDALLRRAR
jgi:hypothetical protein